MESFASVVLLLLLVMPSVMGYPGGPPTTACDNMEPAHPGTTPQTSASPYSINASRTTFYPGDLISVTIHGPYFKGFFLQARTVNSDKHVGNFNTFEEADASSVMCNGYQAASQNKALLTTSFTLEWRAPYNSEDIQFVATVVDEFSTYWVKIPGPILTKSSALLEPVCDLPKNEFTLGELSMKSFHVSWRTPMYDQVEFKVRGVVGADPQNKYVSMAFSDDEFMGNDSVVDCIQKGPSGNVIVQASYNGIGGKFNTEDPAGNPGLHMTSGSRVNGVLQCEFKRDFNIPTNTKFFDIWCRKFKLFVTTGNVNSAGIKEPHALFHTMRPVMSIHDIDFMIPGTYKTLH